MAPHRAEPEPLPGNHQLAALPASSETDRNASLPTSGSLTISDVPTAEADGVRGVWPIKGDAFLSFDLSDVEVQVLERERRHAMILLRPPAVLSARVDHERSMTWDIQRTTWIPWRGDKGVLRAQAYYHAQKLVEYAASRPERIEEAKRHATYALIETYRPLDWTVEVRWR